MIHLANENEVAIVTVIGSDSYTLSRFSSWEAFRACEASLEDRTVSGEPTAESLLAEYPGWQTVTRDDGTWAVIESA